MSRPALPGTIELDTPGHYLEPLHAAPPEGSLEVGPIIGYIEHHPRQGTVAAEGLDCSGAVYIEPHRTTSPRWRITKGTPEAPETLHPSIQCRTCGKHGFIRNRKWEPA